jgi:hypothetical protein
MTTFLDLMPKEEREKALAKAKRRLERAKSIKGHDVSPEFFNVAKAGNYWGWPAICAIRRGYTVEPDVDDQGNLFYKKVVLTLEEVMVFLDAADKVRYSQLIEQIHGGTISNSYKTSSTSFDSALSPFTEKAGVTE